MQEYILSKIGIYYKKNEFKEGRPTLIFVHGLSGSSSAWIKYEEKFEKTVNIVSLDLRGHGKSKKLENYEDYEIKKIAQDIFELVGYLKIKDFFLISHSFGTLAALEFLFEHQDLVKAAVFISPSFYVGNRKIAQVLRPFLYFTKFLSRLPWKLKTGGHIDYTYYKNTGDWNLRRTIADVRNTSLRVYLYSTKQSYSFDKQDFLEKIKIPTLIIHGKKDTVFPVKNSLIMSEKIKNSRLVILPKADHILVLNNYNEVSKEIENFLEENF